MERQVEFTRQGIRVGEQEIPLYSGSIHYWRMKQENWDRALENIKKMGFGIVETYIPWAVHEIAPGEYDFGEKDPDKDLKKFLTLCEKHDLYVIVRPGPHINAEMTLFGYPEWILGDEEIQARSPFGTTVVYPYVTKPFPIPSYASSKLYRETERYFQKLTPLLREHCYPGGGIIAIQADNETCNFFRDAPYILDYSRESEELFHKMLHEKYGDIKRLNAVYETEYEDFSQVKMPAGYKKGQKMEPCFDWVEYKEYQILDALKRMTGILKRMELPIPVFHNCAYQTYTPVSVFRDEELSGLDVAGMDAYPEPGDTDMLKERIRYLCGSSRLPFVPEFGSGSWFDRGGLLKPEEELFGYLYSLMNGLKAVNFYMLVERDRWTGCPVKNDGTIRREWYQMFSDLINLMNGAQVWKYQRKPGILVLKNYDMGRKKALLAEKNRNLFSSNCFIRGTDIPEELFRVEELPDGTKEEMSGHYGSERWIEKIMQMLDAHHLEYDISDSCLSKERMMEYDWVFASSYEWMEPAVQEKLCVFAKEEGRHLCIGPNIPVMDRRGKPCVLLKEEMKQQGEKEKITLLADAHVAEDLVQLPMPEYSCKDSRIEFSVHEGKKEGEHLLYAANTTGEKKEAVIEYNGARSFRSLWHGRDHVERRQIKEVFEPFEIKIWSVEKEDGSYGG